MKCRVRLAAPYNEVDGSMTIDGSQLHVVIGEPSAQQTIKADILSIEREDQPVRVEPWEFAERQDHWAWKLWREDGKPGNDNVPLGFYYLAAATRVVEELEAQPTATKGEAQHAPKGGQGE